MAAVVLAFRSGCVGRRDSKESRLVLSLLHVWGNRQQCYVERVTMSEGIKSNSWIHKLLLAETVRRSATAVGMRDSDLCAYN